VDAINESLSAFRLGPYQDPDSSPDGYVNVFFGRSSLDHHSSRVFEKIGKLATGRRESPNLALIRDNPFRVAFVPFYFSGSIVTSYEEMLAGGRVRISVGSLPNLLKELALLASDLEIPMEGDQLANETAEHINNWTPFKGDDSIELIENQRTAWLALYEGTRLGIHHNIALSLAG